MNLKEYIIGILVISLGMLAITGFLNSLASVDYYNVDVVGGNNYSIYNKVDRITEDFKNVQSNLSAIPAEKGDAGFPTYTIGLFKNAKNILFGSTAGIIGALTLGVTMVTDIGANLDFPPSIIAAIVGMVTVLIVLMLFKILFGRDT